VDAEDVNYERTDEALNVLWWGASIEVIDPLSGEWACLPLVLDVAFSNDLIFDSVAMRRDEEGWFFVRGAR
jgi:hypothetical protein